MSLPSKRIVPVVGKYAPAIALQQRALAGAVGTDQTVKRAGFDSDIHAVQRP